MKQITITLTYSGAVGGSANVALLGPTSVSYHALPTDPSPSRTFTLASGVYTISVQGMSGGTATLIVDDGTNQLVNMSCPPTNIFFATSFPV